MACIEKQPEMIPAHAFDVMICRVTDDHGY